MQESKVNQHTQKEEHSTHDSPRSDYKDDGTNILLDANENAYGPGLALDNYGKLANGPTNNGHEPNLEIDLLGLNRYPDPYDLISSFHHIYCAQGQIADSYAATNTL